MKRKTKISDALWDAILALPPRKQQSILKRLLRKHPEEIEKLSFELLGDQDIQEEMKQEVLDYIETRMNFYPALYTSALFLLGELRKISGKINNYVKVTQDKVGEIEMNYKMLADCLVKNGPILQEEKWGKDLFLYIHKRLIKLDRLSGQVHEDYLLEYESIREIIFSSLRDMEPYQQAIKVDENEKGRSA